MYVISTPILLPPFAGCQSALSPKGHGFIGYPKGRNVERALGPSCPCVLCLNLVK